MVFNLIFLFFAAVIPGTVAFFIPQKQGINYKLILVFAGAYLFSITIIHILPELFTHSKDPISIGLYILIGFFIQLILEYFSSGVEHGHMHVHGENHNHAKSGAIMVLLALSVHAFLEGSLLAHPSTVHAHHESKTLLFGIIIHKAPAAFALMSILVCQLGKKVLAGIFLLIFSLASPLGLFLGDYYVENEALNPETFTIVFAIVSGSFLHISTTIIFENNANHRFNGKKLGVAIFGALIAVMAEMYF
ncbi:ZIP family metal transporter [Fulvivirga sediminis]|uniref:ZIP family metal transporter n=1 Tax=Fulvivirga sediminis TaxID=2803949 RepID=A0A937JYZ6_9BACT|nr:ZIP family metal transporter [Fulvivirga sediminis]MBL3654745.1 ZIP family metal transporter [Fulvivirga sediminis]